MTTEEARQALWNVVKNDDGDRWTSRYSDALDALIVAVRAEALAPRDQSPELEKAEGWLDITGVHLGRLSEPRVISAELDRLRASEKRLEEELRHREIDVRVHSQHVDTLTGERNSCRRRAEKAEEENAKLRELCGWAAFNLRNATKLVAAELDGDQEDVDDALAFVRFLEAAAKGEGK